MKPDEWTALDDLGVEEAWVRDFPRRLEEAQQGVNAACGHAIEALEQLAALLDWDRWLDTELDIKAIRELPEIVESGTK